MELVCEAQYTFMNIDTMGYQNNDNILHVLDEPFARRGLQQKRSPEAKLSRKFSTLMSERQKNKLLTADWHITDHPWNDTFNQISNRSSQKDSSSRPNPTTSKMEEEMGIITTPTGINEV